MSADKCQWCGAEVSGYWPKSWACGSLRVFQEFSTSPPPEFIQSDLCRERVKVARLRRRVEELEGLAIGNEDERAEDGGTWIEVFIPTERLGGANCEGEECPTLGDAMPRKEEL